MYVARHSLALLTAATSDATVYSPVLNGRLESIQLTAGHTLGSTGTIAFTNETTGEPLFSLAIGSTVGWRRYPRPTLVNSTGGAIKPSTGTAMPGYFLLANERIKAVVGKATAAKIGTILLTVG